MYHVKVIANQKPVQKTPFSRDKAVMSKIISHLALPGRALKPLCVLHFSSCLTNKGVQLSASHEKAAYASSACFSSPVSRRLPLSLPVGPGWLFSPHHSGKLLHVIQEHHAGAAVARLRLAPDLGMRIFPVPEVGKMQVAAINQHRFPIGISDAQ